MNIINRLPSPFVKVPEGRKGINFAFTLADILITLGVIGVVSAITLPILFTNITGYINAKRQENIAQKVTQAMEQMRANGLLNTQYATTDEFVDEFQKYIKISKRCDKEHVADCWPTPVVTTGDGEEYEVSQAKTGKHLSLESKSNNVGLVLADGTPIILNYNPKATPIDVGDVVRWSDGLPQYTTSVTGAIDFVMDVNGAKNPNSEKTGNKRDIRPFKTATFTQVNTCEGGVNVPGVGCVVNAGGLYTWQGAIDVCKEKDMSLPDYSTLKLIYDSHIDGLSTSDWCWSSSGISSSVAWGKTFGNSGYSYDYRYKSNTGSALCIVN